MAQGAEAFRIGARERSWLSWPGIDERAVLERIGLDTNALSDRRAALEPDAYYALWRSLEAEAPTAHLPLRAAAGHPPDAFDPASFAALCSPNLDAAARRIAHHARLVGPLRTEITKTPARTRIELRWPASADPPAGLALAELLAWVALVRFATRSDVRPARLVLPTPPEDLRPYRSWLGVDVGRDDVHAVTFAAADASRRFVASPEAMWASFGPTVRVRLKDLEVGAPFVLRARSVLFERLPAGDAALEGVANTLHMSGRTLQRRLRAEGTSYQAVLDATREAVARHYLSGPDLAVAEIAFLLGYDDATSFFRAFRTWTGTTPESMRAALAVRSSA